MTEAPGQQPPQDPREGRREVLEGRVIPSRPHHTPPLDAHDPGGPHAPLAGNQGEPWSPAPGAGSGQAWSITPGAPGTGTQDQSWSSAPSVPDPGPGQGWSPAPDAPDSGPGQGWPPAPDAPPGDSRQQRPGGPARHSHRVTGGPRRRAVGQGTTDYATGPGGTQPPPQQGGSGPAPQTHEPLGGARPPAADPTGARQPGGAQQLPNRVPGTSWQPGGTRPPHHAPATPQRPEGRVPGAGTQQPPTSPTPGYGSDPGIPPQPGGHTPGAHTQPPAPSPTPGYGADPGGVRAPAGRGPGRPSPNPSAGGSPSRAGDPGTPDWGALAEQAASGARRRKLMTLTGGIVAVAVIAGGVATAVVMSGKSSDGPVAGPSASGGTTASQQPLPPEPSFSSVAPPPPANPLDYLSTAAKDTAPLLPSTLFPGRQFLMGGRVYVKTNAVVTLRCGTGARAELAQALPANGCRKLIRATFVNGGVAVTVGVAVFDDTAHATKVQKVARYVAPLNGGGVADFCRAVACRMTSNSVGRYAYFAIAGLKNGRTITSTDTVALQGANDASNFAFQRIIQRGRDAAR